VDAEDALRYGITSIQSMSGATDPITTLRTVAAARLPVRLRVIRFFATDAAGRRTEEWGEAERALPLPAAGATDTSPAPTLFGRKWILDGTPVERLAVMRTPYADRPGWFGRFTVPPDTIRAILRESFESGEQLLLHAVGDSTAALVLALMPEVGSYADGRARRTRLEHGDGVRPEQWRAAGRLGIVVVQNPSHFALGEELMRARFGPRAAEMQPLRSMVAAGIPIALGSDGPMNPFLNIMWAVTHPNNPPEALTREQAVIAYTRGSAYAELAERDKGTLAPGMLADLAVLSQDVFAVPVQALPRTESVLTVVGGRVAYDAGKLVITGRGGRRVKR
jgi:predicted amidohydrolase YtcJ